MTLARACAARCESSSTSLTSTNACIEPKRTPTLPLPSGKDAITAVVDDFVGNVSADTRINTFFVNADIPHLKKELVDQICAATGGPCTYSGKDMKTAHVGMKVKDADFDALVDDLTKSLDKFKVDAKSKGDLLGALGGMRADIVGH